MQNTDLNKDDNKGIFKQAGATNEAGSSRNVSCIWENRLRISAKKLTVERNSEVSLSPSREMLD